MYSYSMYIIFCSFLLFWGNSTWTLFGNSVSMAVLEKGSPISQSCNSGPIFFCIMLYVKMINLKKKILITNFLQDENNFQEAMLSVTYFKNSFLFYFLFAPISDQTFFSFGVTCSQMVFHVCFPLFDCIDTIPTIFVDYLIINLSLFVFLNKYCMSYGVTSVPGLIVHCLLLWYCDCTGQLKWV